MSSDQRIRLFRKAVSKNLGFDPPSKTTISVLGLIATSACTNPQPGIRFVSGPFPLIPALSPVHVVAQSIPLCCIRLLHWFGPAQNHASASNVSTARQNRSVRSGADLPDELFRLNRLKISLKLPI